MNQLSFCVSVFLNSKIICGICTFESWVLEVLAVDPWCLVLCKIVFGEDSPILISFWKFWFRKCQIVWEQGLKDLLLLFTGVFSLNTLCFMLTCGWDYSSKQFVSWEEQIVNSQVELQRFVIQKSFGKDLWLLTFVILFLLSPKLRCQLV